MIKKMLNSSVAATRLAVNIAVNPFVKLPVYTNAMANVPNMLGKTTPLRKIIVTMIISVNKPYNRWEIVKSIFPVPFLFSAIAYAGPGKDATLLLSSLRLLFIFSQSVLFNDFPLFASNLCYIIIFKPGNNSSNCCKNSCNHFFQQFTGNRQR